MIEIYNNSCEVVLKELVYNGRSVDCIIADIPYNINYDTWDKKFDLTSILPLLKQLIKNNGNVIIFNGWSNVCKTKELLDSYFTLEDWIIYDRIKGRGGKRHLVSTREDILWYSNGKDYTFNKIPSTIRKKTGA